MNDFSKAKLLVVGDVMLDQYWEGQANRISPEAPVPVVKIASDQARPGGAANVAMNIAALDAQVTLMGVVGEDTAGDTLDQALANAGVARHWVYAASGTICKLRVLSHHQQLIRMDFEHPVPDTCAQQLADWVAQTVAQYDVLVLSDYAKGALAHVSKMIDSARCAGVAVMVDPKGASFKPYRGATLVKPNQSEFEHMVGGCDNEQAFIAQGQRLCRALDIQAMLITRSEHGMALVQAAQPPIKLQSRAQEVFDVTGAGDTVMATLATAFASGMSWVQSVRLANEAAGLVVKKVGTSTVTRHELQAQWQKQLQHEHAATLTQAQVVERVRTAQQHGETVVFTNGCFDLLHAGHVRYLQEAAKLGDRLVIGVNADASVQRLKGPSRPVVPEAARRELLSALACVDWVVAFTEDTPERLICALKPDVLVKGGDYEPAQIAGADCVKAAGGQVKVLSFWTGYSTTELLETITRVHPETDSIQTGGAHGVD